ncbi:outer membrane beta-barrel protein [Bradyrhizobium sp. dw_78]|uniref:outer membrane protein n=1 Tax=Bradyrhizobium sp. dw_78 TaxID=2719793 RepID=UPI001BD34D19|nr:outer membrane beta-barrel protein [Bradyrhizobium sp. dw_78]
MKKNFLLVALGGMTLGLSMPASAADLAARPYTKAPALVQAAYDWSGFYIGINGGGGTSHTSWDLAGFGSEGSHDATGGTVGGQIGYRWQSANFVFGLEGQGNWADFSGSNTTPIGGNPLGGLTDRTRIDAFGLITGQVGYAWNNVLVYVKGGAAVVDDKYDAYDPLAGTTFGSATEARWGATVGAGLEVGFAPNWSIGAEYNHIFLDNHDATLNDAFGGIADTVRVHQDVDIGLVRLNYRWGGPVIAKY